jgi:hypothetical protein
MAGALVEVLLLSVLDGQLYVRVRTAHAGRRAPDVTARRLVGLPAAVAPTVLHSTSWRFDGARVVLTFVAVPDPAGSVGARRLVTRELARGPRASEPAPARLSLDEVAAHACRHLAFLRATDPAVAEAARENPAIWDLIDETFAPALAGALG